MDANGTKPGTLSREEYTGLLIDRLAATIIDESLPLKEVERELRGCVAEVAVHRRGLGKKETASRCGVTEKSIENYLKEVRCNPKSPEREIARVLQDTMMSLEEIFDAVRHSIAATRNFDLDDAKRSLEKLIRTGEVCEYPGHKYRAVQRPSIRYPETIDAHRELVDQKARDLDYIILSQKDAAEEEILSRRGQRFSRVVGDTNLIRIDFTTSCAPENLPGFFEKLSEGIARLTMEHEEKKGASRIRLILGMRSVLSAILLMFAMFVPAWNLSGEDGNGGDDGDGGGATSWELDQVVLRDDDEKDSVDRSDRVSLLRGDIDLSEEVNLTDAILLTTFLAGNEPSLPCMELADINGDARVTLADALWLFEILYADSSTFGGWTVVDLSDAGPLDCEAYDPSA